MTETNYIGNISAIIKFVSMPLAGYLIALLASYGLNLPIDQAKLSELIGMIIFFILAYIDAKNPHSLSFLGFNKNADMETVLNYPQEETVMNEESMIEGDEN